MINIDHEYGKKYKKKKNTACQRLLTMYTDRFNDIRKITDTKKIYIYIGPRVINIL